MLSTQIIERHRQLHMIFRQKQTVTQPTRPPLAWQFMCSPNRIGLNTVRNARRYTKMHENYAINNRLIYHIDRCSAARTITMLAMRVTVPAPSSYTQITLNDAVVP